MDFSVTQDEGISKEMPANKNRGHRNRTNDDHKDKRANDKKVQRANFRKQHRELYIKETSDPLEDKRKHDEKLLTELSDIVGDYSQQRMRALHMSFRQYGNDENRMTSKEMIQSLQENNISFPSVLQKALIAKFESSKGIDLEALFKFLKESHSRTGRDSVLAMHKRNDLSQRYTLSQDEVDDDLLWRIESQLIKGQAYIDLEELRTEFQKRDNNKCGRIDSLMMKHVCDELQLPVFGSLLKNLIKRCDEDRNDKICWPQFLSFLERAQENARISCPSLKTLPEQMKSRTPVEPTPLDELSSKTRLSIVSKLRKKSANVIKKSETQNNETKINNDEQSKEQNIDKSTSVDKQSNIMSVTENNQHLSIQVNDEAHTQTQATLAKTNTTKVEISKETIIEEPTEESRPSSKEKPPINDTEPDKAEKTLVNTDQPPNPNTSTPKKDTNDTQQTKLKQDPIETDVEDKTSTETVNISEVGKYTKGDEEEVEEKVTFKNGEIIGKEMATEIKPMQTKTSSNGKITYSIETHNKNLTFEADSEFLSKQNIDPPTQRLKLQWVIDIHSNKMIVATGQYANRKDASIKAQVRVWRADNLQTLHVFGDGKFEKSIACVAFAPDKDILAVVDNCTEKKLTIWDTNTGEIRGQELLHTDLLCDMGFNTKYPDTLVTVGKEHTCWWKVYPESETVQSSSIPEYDNFLRAKFVICLTFTERGDLITGDSNGTIYVFGDGGNRITNFIKHAHDGPVFTVLFYQGQILSGGRDGIIHAWQWSRNMDSSGFLQLPKTEGGVRMLRVLKNDLLVGTTMNSMLACKMTTSDGDPPLQGAILEQQPICQCHYDDLRGLTIASESRADVITAGLDGMICGFNSSARTAVSKVQFKGNQYVCVDSNKSGTQLVLGTKDGHLQILCHMKEEWVNIMNRKICKERIDCIRLSPDDRSVAMGTHDGYIYVVSYIQRDDGTFVWEYVGKLQGHTSAVNGMDWSIEKEDDGFILRSSCVNMELKHWLPRTLESFYKNDVISQTTWNTTTVHIDSAISGILSTNEEKGVEITSLDTSDYTQLAANGDTSGKLRLFKYPCSLSGSFCHAYRGHAFNHTLKFTSSGNYVMTVGGRDSCLMQWAVV
ncbi:hypothetical protein ACF0H5_021983 [Mactra antiquata]